MKKSIGIVISNEHIGDRYYKVKVKNEYLANIIKEGQFVEIKCGKGTDPLLRRPFSIYKYDREKNEVEFAYLVKGKGTEILKNLEKGDEIDFLGPLGNSYKINKDTKGIVIIGRGVGIASIASLGEKAVKEGKKTIAILSGRNEESVISQNYLKEVGCEVIPLMDTDGSSSVENLEKILRQKISTGEINQLYSCGSNRIGRLAKKLSEEYDLDSYISFEERMACGIGVCKGCAIMTTEGYKNVCKDGPIFNVKEVEI
jgi:dihydroorotate dehydrogenase electron transfer subunit